MGGESVPALGFGTYRMTGRECRKAVQTALDVGYRHLDTAMAYENETEVGEAIAASDVDREEVFVTTKVKGYAEYLEYDGVVRNVEESIDRLGLDSVDLVLIHWWNPSIDVKEPISALNRLQADGKIRHIGVSNFSTEQLAAAIEASETPIVTNQVEYHPYRDEDDLLSFCRDNDVVLTAYSPLCEGRVVSDDTLATIGDRYDKTPAQVALRWLIQQPDVAAIPKARRRTHQIQNLDVFDFELSPDEIEAIDALEGPLLYRLNSEGGLIYRFRSRAGSVYSTARSTIPL